jgi:hypothetical protein
MVRREFFAVCARMRVDGRKDEVDEGYVTPALGRNALAFSNSKSSADSLDF